MAKILVHITCGPESPTRAALGFLVGKTALDEGHEVSFFLAGDGVQLLRDEVLNLSDGDRNRQPQGVVGRHRRGWRPLLLSGMSSQARGIREQDLDGKPAEMAVPNRLVQLTVGAIES